MNFTVTYRDRNGALREESVEAADRAACMAECRSRGIAPVKIAEGKGANRRRDGGVPSHGRDGVRPSRNGRRLTGKAAVLAAVAIAVVGGVAWWWCGHAGRVTPPVEKPKVEKPKAEKRANPAPKPSPAATNAPTRAARVSARGTPIPDDVKPDASGVLRHPGGLRWVDTNDLHVVKHPRKKRLFKHHSENSIATILTLDPDRMAPFLVGRRPKFGKRFVDDFKASLHDEAVFPDDDTEDEREVRKAVIEVKREMAEALNRGEDIAKMMNDAQDELDRLVSYRDTLMKQLKQIKLDEKYTDQDVADFTAAANQMLKEQGLKELRTPNLTYRQMMLQRRRERMDLKNEGGEGAQPTTEKPELKESRR